MKVVYRIDLYGICKDKATMDAIAASLLASLRAKKASGDVTEGDVKTTAQDVPETITAHEGA